MSEELGMNIKLTAEVADFSAKIESAKTKLANLAIEAKTLKQGEREIEAALKSAKKEYGEESKEVEKLNAKLVDNHKAQIDLKTETAKLNKELKQSQSTFDKLTKETKENTSALSANAKQADKTMQSIKTGFTMLKGMIVGYAGKTLFDALIGSNAQFEQKMTSFEVLLGGAEKAQKMMEDLEEFAAKTPLQMDDVSSATQLLLSYGVAQEDVMTRMRQLGDLAQGNAEKLDRVSLAYGQMLAKGKVTGEELRQMTEAGVPLVQDLADVIGISTAELSKMLETGSVGIPELNKAIESMTSEGGKFYNMMEKQSQTMSGMWSTLADNAKIFSRDVGEETFEYLKGELNSLMDTINQMKESGELDEIAGDIGERISNVIEFVIKLAKFLYEMKDAVAAAAGAFVGLKISMAISSLISGVITAINGLVTGLKSVKTASDLARVATEALKTSQLATPWGAIAAVIGLVVGALASYNIVAGEATSETDKLIKETKELREAVSNNTLEIEKSTASVEVEKNKIDDLISTMEQLDSKIELTDSEKQQLRDTAAQLENKISDLNIEIDSETGHLQTQIGVVKELADNYIRLSYAKAYASEFDNIAKQRLELEKSNYLLQDKIDNKELPKPKRTGGSIYGVGVTGTFILEEEIEENNKSLKDLDDQQKALLSMMEEDGITLEEVFGNSNNTSSQRSYSGSSISGGSSSSSSSAAKEKEPVYRELAYIYPFDNQYQITSGFGDIAGRTVPHDAIDIGAPYGAPVKASNAGTVIFAGWAGGYGNYVEIDHGNGDVTTYGHLSSISVSAGQTVDRGQKIGEVGSTGTDNAGNPTSTGPHLDFRFRRNGVYLDPNKLFTGEYGTVITSIEGSGSSAQDDYDNAQEKIRQQQISDYKESNSKKMSDFERQMKMDFAYGYITEEEFIKSIEIEAQAYKELADDVLKQDYMTTQEKMDLWEEYFKKSEDLSLDHYEQLKAYEKDNLNYSIEQSKKWIEDRKADGQWSEGDNIAAAWGRVIEKFKKFYNEDFYNINQAREYLDGLSSLMDEATADILETMDKAVSEVSALKKEAYEKEQAAEQERIEKQFEETENALNRELELVKKKYNDRISYLDRLKKERSRQKEDDDDNLKMERLQTKLEYEMDEGNKKSLQREINSLNEEIEDKEFDRWIEAEKEKANSAMEIETEKIEAMIEKEKIKRMEMIDYVAEYYAEKMTEDALQTDAMAFLNLKSSPDELEKNPEILKALLTSGLPVSTINQMNGLFDTIDINGIAWRVADLVDIAGAFLEKYGFAGNQTVINNYKNDNSTTTISSTYQIKDLSKSEITKAKQKSLEEYIRDGYVL